MEVPERLALIGGGILLSSLLVFTLKSQASHLLPKVEHPINSIYSHAGDAQKTSDFNNDYHQAQQKHWQTGTWGTAKYYIDKNNNLHVGQGQLNGAIFVVLGQDRANTIKSVNIDQNVQAPQMSDGLFAQLPIATSINGLENVDTSQVVKAGGFFANDNSLQQVDLSDLNTSSFQDMSWMFNSTWSLKNIDLSNFNTKNANDISMMFANDGSDISDLNLSSFDTSHVNNMYQVFGNWNPHSHDTIGKITLGDKTYVHGDTGANQVNYQNGNQVLNSSNLYDGNSHPGTWVKQ